MECSHTVIIDKPIQEVWDYTNNPDNLPLWLNNFVRYEHVSGDPTAPKVGDLSDHTYEEKGKEFTMREEIKSYNPPHSISLYMTHSMFELDIVNTLEETGPNQTKLFAGATVIPGGLFMKIMMMFMSKKKQQNEHQVQIEKLKELIEAQ